MPVSAEMMHQPVSLVDSQVLVVWVGSHWPSVCSCYWMANQPDGARLAPDYPITTPCKWGGNVAASTAHVSDDRDAMPGEFIHFFQSLGDATQSDFLGNETGWVYTPCGDHLEE